MRNLRAFQRLIAYFAQEDEVLLAYLFGSRVAGKTGDLSDYDIAVLLRARQPQSFRYELASSLAQLLDADRVDLVILNDTSIELRYNVIATGKLLYMRDRVAKVEFEAETLSRYFDYLPILREQKQEIIAGGNDEAGVCRYRAALGKTQKVLAEIGAAQREEARRVAAR